MVAGLLTVAAATFRSLRVLGLACFACAVVLLPGFSPAADHQPPAMGDLCRMPELENALVAHRQILLQGGWPRVPAGPTLREGDRNERVSALRERLLAGADRAEPEGRGDLFDGTLREAVQRFQARHGLAVDGLVGVRTLGALNVSVGTRIQQLAASIEGCEDLASLHSQRYVLVNIPDFTLTLFDRGDAVMSMPVIVGTMARQTPEFNGRISSLVLNPFWNVPVSIAARDILPEAIRDPEYLQRMNIRIVRDWTGREEIDSAAIDWARLSPKRFPYRLRQLPGPVNSLGRVKFMFPNPHDFYMHDTPARELFGKDVRAFSSGCIRVAEPLELALYLLRGTPLDSIEALTEALSSGETRSIAVPSPLDVHIVYITAWVDHEGVVHFRQDIYGRH